MSFSYVLEQCYDNKSKVLNLENFGLPSLPSQISSWYWIETLIISHNNISSLDYAPKNLKCIIAINCPLTSKQITDALQTSIIIDGFGDMTIR